MVLRQEQRGALACATLFSGAASLCRDNDQSHAGRLHACRSGQDHPGAPAAGPSGLRSSHSLVPLHAGSHLVGGTGGGLWWHWPGARNNRRPAWLSCREGPWLPPPRAPSPSSACVCCKGNPRPAQRLELLLLPAPRGRFLLGAVVALGLFSGIAFSAAYQLVARFANKNVIGGQPALAPPCRAVPARPGWPAPPMQAEPRPPSPPRRASPRAHPP